MTKSDHIATEGQRLCMGRLFWAFLLNVLDEEGCYLRRLFFFLSINLHFAWMGQELVHFDRFVFALLVNSKTEFSVCRAFDTLKYGVPRAGEWIIGVSEVLRGKKGRNLRRWPGRVAVLFVRRIAIHASRNTGETTACFGRAG